MMPDIRKAYDILSKNNLLNYVFDFTEIFLDNYEVYSFELQKAVQSKELNHPSRYSVLVYTYLSLVF